MDAALWYFEAVRQYVAATNDLELLRELYPVLVEMIDAHVHGTRYQIHVDPEDGLLYAGEAGVQLTWMDAKVGERVMTPRIGKPVEINALWLNAVSSMTQFARLLGRPTAGHACLVKRARKGFARFWNEAAQCCFDVIDGPNGNDASIRPNQIFAVSLPESALSLLSNSAPWWIRAAGTCSHRTDCAAFRRMIRSIAVITVEIRLSGTGPTTREPCGHGCSVPLR